MLRKTLLRCKPIPTICATVEEALGDLTSGATLAVGGFGYTGAPFELLEEVHRRRCTDLTLYMSSMAGQTFGVGPLAKDERLRKVVTCYMGDNRVFSDAFYSGKLEVELCPMGSLADRMKAGGAGMPAFYTTTGYGTMVAEGGVPQRYDTDGSGSVALVSSPRESRMIDGKWCVLETALKADFGLLRAWKADKRGNLIFRGCNRNFNTAAAKCGKTCIVQVDEVVEFGELDPNEVHMPGVYVDRIVPVTAEPRVEFLVTRDAEKGGSTTEDVMSVKHRLARRAALEVGHGMVVNLGVGVPTLVSQYVPAEKRVLLMGGHGILGIGPHPLPNEVDPNLTNASRQTVTADRNVGPCFFDAVESAAMIRGGYVDMALMGAMEVAENGDIANWMVPGKRISGMGGGMELVQSGCSVVVMTTHTDKDGAPKLLHRCKAPLTGRGVVSKIITELAVFDVVPCKQSGTKKLVLTELAEGVTLEEVRARTEALYEVSSSLQPMRLAPVLPA